MKLNDVLGIVTIVVWYVMHGSYIAYIPSILKSNSTVTLTFDVEGQYHILFPMIDKGHWPNVKLI